MIKYKFFVVLLLLMNQLEAQNTMTYRDALEIAFRNNYNLLIAENDATIAKRNNTVGNAGFLPTATAGFDVNRATRDSRLSFFNGQLIEADDARSDALNTFVQLDWVVFDGFRMYATKRRLKELEQLGKLELQFQLEQVALAIAENYYRIVQEQKLLAVFQQALQVSKQQFEIEKRAFEIGGRSELEKLNAAVNLNADSARILEQVMLVKNLKSDLNLLLARDAEVEFDVVELFEVDPNLTKAAIATALKDQNKGLQMARTQSRIRATEVRESRANFYPTVGLFADYSLNRQVNEVGLLESNLTRGPNIGLSVRWNLFNGLNDQRALQERKLLYENAQNQVAQVELEALNNLYKRFNEYEYALSLLQLETKNVATARKNLSVAKESLRLGSISQIEFRIIQQSELEAEQRQLRAGYLAKLAELQMRQLGGVLLLAD